MSTIYYAAAFGWGVAGILSLIKGHAEIGLLCLCLGHLSELVGRAREPKEAKP